MSLSFVSSENINNVVLVVSDSLRADTAAERMPFLQQLADESASFESCYAVGPHTPSSMSGMMQSRLPINKGYGTLLPETVPTIAEVLESAGVNCGGWHCNPHTLSERGFDRGFGVYSDLLTQPPQYRPHEESEDVGSSTGTWRHEVRNIANQLGVRKYLDEFSEVLKRHGFLTSDPRVPAEQTVDAFETWLANVQGQSRFAYLHFMDTHMPYDPPDSHWNTSELDPISSRRAHVLYRRMKKDDHNLTDDEINDLRRLYEAEAEHVDGQVERIVETLKTNGEWESSLLIFTSDHGELFGDRTAPDGKRVDHPSYLCEELTHVPLVVAGGSVAPNSEGSLVSGLDIAPTVTKAFDICPPDEWAGKALGTGGHNQIRAAVASPPGSVTKIDPEWLHVGIRDQDRAVLWWRNDTPTEYYTRGRNQEIRDNDPDESAYHDIKTTAESYIDYTIETGPRSDEDNVIPQERLKNLGYID
jgi:arylsulfatase A-like enzyme